MPTVIGEIGLLPGKGADLEEIKKLGGIPFAAHISDPCHGRSKGTTAMFDSLAYRNDASLVMRRQRQSPSQLLKELWLLPPVMPACPPRDDGTCGSQCWGGHRIRAY